jgi:hypothetical protein
VSTIDYEGRVFRAVANAANGEVSGWAVFYCDQTHDVWATY